MKHVKDYKLFEFGENSTFETEEIDALENLGFRLINGEMIYNNDDLEIKIRRDSETGAGEINEWFVLTYKRTPSFSKEITKPNYYKSFKMSESDYEQKKCESLDELIYEIQRIKKY